jgi:hypothetical protein
MAEPKDPKKEMWLTIVTGFAGLMSNDYELELHPVAGGKVHTVIRFSLEKEWPAAQLFMALLDSNYGPIEIDKASKEYKVSFMWPAGMACPYVTPQA